MCLWYQNHQSLQMVSDLFSVEFPHRPIPACSTILRVYNTFKTEGCVADHKKKNRTKTVLTEEMKLNILFFVEENPFRSLNFIASEFNISPSSVRNILKIEKCRCYKLQNRQQLFEIDKISRTDFCEEMFDLLNQNEDLLYKICFTDEATFYLNGKVNSQNYRYDG